MIYGVDWFVWWVVICGLGVNVWIAWKMGGMLGHVVYAAVAASSITRFAWACAREHGFREQRYPHWVYVPRFWFSFFATELDARQGNTRHFGGNGVWEGVGKWVVHPKKEGA